MCVYEVRRYSKCQEWAKEQKGYDCDIERIWLRCDAKPEEGDCGEEVEEEGPDIEEACFHCQQIEDEQTNEELIARMGGFTAEEIEKMSKGSGEVEDDEDDDDSCKRTKMENWYVVSWTFCIFGIKTAYAHGADRMLFGEELVMYQVNFRCLLCCASFWVCFGFATFLTSGTT